VKSSEVSVHYDAVTKHHNFITKIDSPPSTNNKTPKKYLWFAIVLHMKNYVVFLAFEPL